MNPCFLPTPALRAGRWFRCAVMVMLALLTGPVRAAETGWVESVTGAAELIRIQRSGAVLDTRLFMSLEDGDQIMVPSGATLVVQLHSGDTLRLDASNTPYSVPNGAREAATVGSNLVAWAGGWLTSWYQESAKQQTTVAMSRGSNPYIRSDLLAADVHYIVLPKPSLCLSWSGGTPPYELILRNNAGVELTRTRVDKAHAGCVPAGALAAGSASITIDDAAQERLRARLELLAPESDPALGEELVASDTDRRLATVVEAAWIAAEGGSAWWLEAYQRLAPVAPGFEPAVQLMNALSQGRAPERP